MTLTSTPVDCGLICHQKAFKLLRERAHPHVVAACLFRVGYPSIDDVLDVSLQPPSKVLEHGGTTRKDDVLGTIPSASAKLADYHPTYLVQTPPDIDRTRLNNIVHDLRQGRQEIRTVDLGIEEDFRGEESFVADINVVFPSRDAVFSSESRKVLVRIGVVFADLLDDVLAYVGVVFLDFFGAEKRRSAGMFARATTRLTLAVDPQEGCAPALLDPEGGSTRIQ